MNAHIKEPEPKLHPASLTTGVPDAVLKIEGDSILISDHENTLLLNRNAAIELLELLPSLIAKLPIGVEPIHPVITKA